MRQITSTQGQVAYLKLDPAYNTAVKITATTDTTITLDVGKSSNQTEHIFVSAANSVISGGDYIHTFENAELDALLIAERYSRSCNRFLYMEMFTG